MEIYPNHPARPMFMALRLSPTGSLLIYSFFFFGLLVGGPPAEILSDEGGIQMKGTCPANELRVLRIFFFFSLCLGCSLLFFSACFLS